MSWHDMPLVATPAQWVETDAWPFSADLLYELIHSGEIRSTSVGRRYAVTREALIEFFGDTLVPAELETQEGADREADAIPTNKIIPLAAQTRGTPAAPDEVRP